MTIPTGIWITTPDRVHGTFGLEIYLPDNPTKVEKFKELCISILMRTTFCDLLGTFYQGGHDHAEWKYFEFLKTGRDSCDEIQNIILDLGLDIAGQLGLELEIH